MEDLSENENTVAVLTIYYKEKQLTNLVFKRREMADKFVDTLQQLLNEEGKKDFSFSGSITTVYDSQTLSEDLGGFLNGTIKPKGTLAEIMQLIKVAGMNEKEDSLLPIFFNRYFISFQEISALLSAIEKISYVLCPK